MENNKTYKNCKEENKKMLEKTKSFFRKVAFGGLVSIVSFGIADRAKADAVPADFFATNTEKILKLADYDAVQTTPNWDDFYGTIKWDNLTKDNLPTGYRTWALDANKKPCGVFNISTAGSYGFLHAYEDDSTTPSIDEGALAGDVMSVLVQEIATKKMYEARFVNEPVSFHADKGRYNQNILVNPTPIPEPATLGLVLGGLGLMALKKRRRK